MTPHDTHIVVRPVVDDFLTRVWRPGQIHAREGLLPLFHQDPPTIKFLEGLSPSFSNAQIEQIRSDLFSLLEQGIRKRNRHERAKARGRKRVADVGPSCQASRLKSMPAKPLFSLQTDPADGVFRCETWTAMTGSSSRIVLSGCGHPQLRPMLKRLRESLAEELSAIAVRNMDGARPLRCPQGIEGPLDCEFPRAESNLLVVVGTAEYPIRETPLMTRAVSDDWIVVPVYPVGEHFLPAILTGRHIGSWQATIEEVVPWVLAAARITSNSFRVFISYKRSDAAGRAEELFQAFSEVGFDVFLDRVRLEPGSDFMARLEEELSNTAMVVVLESPQAATSKWVSLETGYARTHRLGLLAVSFANSPQMRGIRVRVKVKGQSSTRLSSPDIRRIVAATLREHGRALVVHRNFYWQALTKALQKVNAATPRRTADDILHTGSRTGTKSYGFWVTPRPPELSDFRAADLAASRSKEVGCVLGPTSALQNLRRDTLLWLAGKSGIRFADEGQILKTARMVADGRL
jgi:hypothetical protein